MSIINLREIANIFQEAGKIEQYKQILEAQKEMSEMQKKISDLEKDNANLKDKLETKKNLTFRNSAYWAEGDSEPFCSRCLEVDGKAIHLHPNGNPAYYFCSNCKVASIKAKPELDRQPTPSSSGSPFDTI